MNNNGSPAPEFHTDEGRTYFHAVLYIHSAFKGKIEEGTRLGLSWDQVKEWEINSLEDVNKLLGYLLEQKSNQVDNQVGDEVGDIVKNEIHKYAVKILIYCKKARMRKDILKSLLNLYINQKNFNTYIKPLIDINLLNYSKPEKLSSSKQAYITTNKGKLLLKILKKEND